jgi:hypothetical protein
MLLLEGYISNFTCARYYFLYVEFSGFYVKQSLAGQTIYFYLSLGMQVTLLSSVSTRMLSVIYSPYGHGSRV